MERSLYTKLENQSGNYSWFN